MRWAPLIITSLFVSLLVMARVAEFIPEPVTVALEFAVEVAFSALKSVAQPAAAYGRRRWHGHRDGGVGSPVGARVLLAADQPDGEPEHKSDEPTEREPVHEPHEAAVFEPVFEPFRESLGEPIPKPVERSVALAERVALGVPECESFGKPF